ncbi:MAG: hypothetical protein JW821_04000 [Deltaproteobacteria bacterium]|nr:hypothetical protein [Deltaproteobacteria bacterium]
MTNKRKDGNIEGDLVLIYYQENPALYARIEAIEPDVKRDWYQVTLLLLTIPAQVARWTLREEYINGAPFTMGGTPMRLEGVKGATPPGVGADREAPSGTERPGRPARVIPLKKDRP